MSRRRAVTARASTPLLMAHCLRKAVALRSDIFVNEVFRNLDDVSRVGFLELDNLHPTDLRTDDLPDRVFALPNGVVYIDHGATYGQATIVPSPASERDESIVVSGFLLAGLLDQEF